MIVKLTAKRQVTFPARVLDALGVKPGDRLELEQGPTDSSCVRVGSIVRGSPRYAASSLAARAFSVLKVSATSHDGTLRD